MKKHIRFNINLIRYYCTIPTHYKFNEVQFKFIKVGDIIRTSDINVPENYDGVYYDRVMIKKKYANKLFKLIDYKWYNEDSGYGFGYEDKWFEAKEVDNNLNIKEDGLKKNFVINPYSEMIKIEKNYGIVEIYRDKNGNITKIINKDDVYGAMKFLSKEGDKELYRIDKGIYKMRESYDVLDLSSIK